MCLGFMLEQLSPETLRLPRPKKFARRTKIESPGWRLLTDGSFERHPDGTEAAGWGIAAVSPDNCVRSLCGPITCDPWYSAFFWSCLLQQQIDLVFSHVVSVCASSTTPSTLLVLPLVSPTFRCNDLVLRSKKITFIFTTSLGTLATPGTSAPTLRPLSAPTGSCFLKVFSVAHEPVSRPRPRTRLSNYITTLSQFLVQRFFFFQKKLFPLSQSHH